jgi:hypothetical protein
VPKVFLNFAPGLRCDVEILGSGSLDVVSSRHDCSIFPDIVRSAQVSDPDGF